jgi:hypothetical protein
MVNLLLGFLILCEARSGYYSDVRVSIRVQRRGAYMVYGISMAVLLVILIFAGAPVI